MLDKAKSDNLITKMRKEEKSDFSEEIFTLDSFSDDDNLLQLDDIDSLNNISKIQKTEEDLDIIDEEFDNYDEALKQLDQYDLEALQLKLGVELTRDEIEQKLGIDTEDTLKQQLISMESEMNLLKKEEKLLNLELEELQTQNDEFEALNENKENHSSNIINGLNEDNYHFNEKYEIKTDKLDHEISQFTLKTKTILENIGNSIYQTIEHLSPNSDLIRILDASNCSINSSGISDFIEIISNFISKLTSTYDTSLHSLKSLQTSISPFKNSPEMTHLISN